MIKSVRFSSGPKYAKSAWKKSGAEQMIFFFFFLFRAQLTLALSWSMQRWVDAVALSWGGAELIGHLLANSNSSFIVYGDFKAR
jgi:hypothetical protein